MSRSIIFFYILIACIVFTLFSFKIWISNVKIFRFRLGFGRTLIKKKKDSDSVVTKTFVFGRSQVYLHFFFGKLESKKACDI